MEITTPMMQHWAKIKSKYKDFIVFYRLGDFYEMFEEDAQIGSRVLNLTLTSRSGHPMCGVPYHAYKIYIKKLISNGYKVVICEQLEDPAKAKGMVKRGVTEVITPGTVIESDLLATDNNFISSIYIEKGKNEEKYEENYLAGICWCDISSGEFFASEILLNNNEKEGFEQIYTFLEKIKPSEIVISSEDRMLKNLSKRFFTTTLSESYFEGSQIDSLLNSFFSVYSIEDLGIRTLLLKKCINALILYLKENEVNIKPILSKVDLVEENNLLSIDSRTLHNLEIFEPFLPIDKTYTLFSSINLTKTSMGKRLLKRWLNFPLKDKTEIENRYFKIEKIIYDYNTQITIPKILSV
jgi:DNA mismatch repair protein MutS